MNPRVRKDSSDSASVQIERYYRQQISSGGLAPGTKLPTNERMRAAWSTSSEAIRVALSNLAADGLIERTKGRGTFVCYKKPPTMVGIFIGPNLVNAEATFYRNLSTMLEEKLGETNFSTRFYDNMTDCPKEIHVPGRDSSRHFRFDAQYFNFKGYICIGTTNVSRKRLPDDLTPRSVFQDISRNSDVILDMRHFNETCFTEFIAQGVRRLAYIRFRPSYHVGELLPLDGVDMLRQRPDVRVDFWEAPIRFSPRMEEASFDPVIQGWFADGRLDTRGERNPEVIIVPDDIMVRPLIINLLKRGIRIPEDIRICIQTTSSANIYYGVPTHQYSFPVDKLADGLLDTLRLRIARRPTPDTPIMIRGQLFMAH